MELKFEKLKKESSMSSKIVNVIKMKLIEGTLKPGDKLPTEAELVKLLGVSRTPLREAIKILEAIGIVTIKRGTGMFISTKTSHSNLNPLILNLIMHSNNIKKLVEFRQSFEMMVLDMIGKDKSIEKIKEIKRVHERLVERYEKAADYLTSLELAEMDLQFHYAILEATNNPFVIEVGKTIYELSKYKIKELIERVGMGPAFETHQTYLDTLFNEENKSTLKEKIEYNWRWLEREE